MSDDTKEWVTIKIPKAERDDAREDDRTYGEIMRAGLNDDRVTTTGEDPLAMYEDFRDVVQEAVQEALPERTGAVELEATSVKEIADEIEGRLR